MSRMKSLTRLLDKSLLLISVSCLAISILGAIIAVFLRYVLGISLQTIEEICRYAIIYGVFAYIGPLILKNEHLKMDILKDMLKGKA
ncbi:TRAP transporter small permease subunit [Bacillus sp. B15-48]|uniref:TRAP transporter small permease n=1 Tax=Bacillus sp. B15-48 TaxID=1548601 RepID=UPI001EF1ADA0|nr:TRAP transporter small permease subunit [Bacillus sp. B15-48]MBM4763666.1 TRAP transporter small permease subunit [Bacillus sp. B15-48]